MWTNMLILNGAINQKDNEEINEENFFKLLEDNGYEFEGGVGNIERSKMIEAIYTISGAINDKGIESMVATLKSHYGDMNDESIVEFLECNTGTGIFQKVFLDNLHDNQLIELFNRYSNTNWQISDEFEGLLGEEVVKKFTAWRENVK
ncbi:hypothetical protein MHB40_14520 [Lysinibacillus sp. FSL K6-0057]|uniref:hypothetical protein n=1 Tax=Lysinibacillus sp. FSL K6-0057 TaxID=2921411 RepID=UPI003159BB7E